MTDTSTYDKISLLRLAFKGLDEDELREMADLTEIHTYPPGHVLCLEGAFEDVFYIIADGNAEITKKMIEGEDDRILRLARRGDMVGEMALIQNAPRAATVRTTSECTVLEMEKQDFETILRRSPRMAMDIIRITLDRIRANDQSMIEELQKSNKVLRQLDRNKLEFIQVAAHELRTPLTVLNGYVNVLRSLPNTSTNANFGEVIQGILKGTSRIHEVVNLMLDVTRIGTETLKIASVPVLLKRILDDLIRDFEKAAAERRIAPTLCGSVTWSSSTTSACSSSPSATPTPATRTASSAPASRPASPSSTSRISSTRPRTNSRASAPSSDDSASESSATRRR